MRNGGTTIHTWDIEETTGREKYICDLLLKNRRKKDYGILDGNALSLKHFSGLDPSISKDELDALVKKNILKHVPYQYRYVGGASDLTDAEDLVLSFRRGDCITVDELKVNKEFKIRKVGISDTIDGLVNKGVLKCNDLRYDFKHGKISTGLYGINRIFLRTSKIYPTMVASDTNDYIATVNIDADTPEEYKAEFMEKIYRPHNYRQITKKEACMIQGFPADYILPESRPRWMKLIGNSIAVSLVRMLAQSVVNTGVFDERDYVDSTVAAPSAKQDYSQGTLFDL